MAEVFPGAKDIARKISDMSMNPISRSEAGISPPRFITFYLPQFYPTPYNDEWWGRGFTEWTNVVRARPRFRGHYQPHLPADIGFYDLRLPETREAQARLAHDHGIYGFCYYHYWFNGQRVLERPLDEVLKLGKPDFPFCICWANENWTRSWDGLFREVLLQQTYSPEDDMAHIRHLIPVMGDRRYIRIEGKPLLLVYRVELIQDPNKMADVWRREALSAGLGDLFLVNVQSSYLREGIPPQSIGFDATVRFQPSSFTFRLSNIGRAFRALDRRIRGDTIFLYKDLYRGWKTTPPPNYRSFDCVAPMWDNSARRKREAFILKDSTPEQYEQWLLEAATIARPDREGHRWVFINAWNEWGEGCHLEPCQKWKRAYLEATKRVYAA